MDHTDTSGKALLDHWKWATEKGLVNLNTANALKVACSQVLGVLDGWEKVDVRKIDVADLCRRFQSKRNKDFKPASLEIYKRRFAQAVKLFMDYINNPSGWRVPFKGRGPRKGKKSLAASSAAAPSSTAPSAAAPSSPAPRVAVEAAAKPGGASVSQGNGLVDYPYPLREGRVAYVRLPIDLKLAEVKRLSAYLTTLAIDFEPTVTG